MPIHNTYRLGTIEMLDHDLEELEYPVALIEIKRLGEGWRVPTLQECSMLQELADLGVGGFAKHPLGIYYWTSQGNVPNPSYQRTWNFDSQESTYHHQHQDGIRVRPVRSI